MPFGKLVKSLFPRRRLPELNADLKHDFTIENRVQCLDSYLESVRKTIARRQIAHHCRGLKQHCSILL